MLDPWYRFILEKVKDIDMDIKHALVKGIEFYERDEFGDLDLEEAIEWVDTVYDYDFFNDEVIESDRLFHGIDIIPQDGVRYSIINIISYCCGKYVNKYMELYTKNSNSYREGVACSLVMKNEFLFKRVMLTDAKKNYASIMELQEGNMIPSGMKSLDIKGLPMNKSTLNKNTSKKLKEILYEDVLNSEAISQPQILKSIIILEKQIFKSLSSGEKKYYKPATVKSQYAYEDPLRISGFKGCMAWNELVGEGYELFDLESKNTVEIIKVDISKKTITKLKDRYPEVHARAEILLQNPRFATGLNGLSIPLECKVPEWVFEVIDYTTIINDNLKVFPLESIGIQMTPKVNNTNIISF